MKRKTREVESRDLRTLRKRAHERAAQIDAPDRPRIDLEEILGVPLGPVEAEPTSGTPGPACPAPSRTTVSTGKVNSESPPEPTRDPAAPVIVEELGQRQGTTGWYELVRLSREGARHNLRFLAEFHLSTVEMLAAPFISWRHIQTEAANRYLKAVRNALVGVPKG